GRRGGLNIGGLADLVVAAAHGLWPAYVAEVGGDVRVCVVAVEVALLAGREVEQRRARVRAARLPDLMEVERYRDGQEDRRDHYRDHQLDQGESRRASAGSPTGRSGHVLSAHVDSFLAYLHPGLAAAADVGRQRDVRGVMLTAGVLIYEGTAHVVRRSRGVGLDAAGIAGRARAVTLPESGDCIAGAHVEGIGPSGIEIARAGERGIDRGQCRVEDDGRAEDQRVQDELLVGRRAVTGARARNVDVPPELVVSGGACGRAGPAHHGG